jgi:SAM-dependent methyltransferase
MIQCPVCKSDKLSDEIIEEGLQQYKCNTCGFLFPAKTNEIKDIAKPDVMQFIHKHRDVIKQYIRQKEIDKYKGDNVFCPVCLSGFQSFAPYYAWFKSKKKDRNEMDDLTCVTFNESARCPNCNSLERHRLLWKYLHERTDVFDKSNKRLLDFAPDEFFFDAFMNQANISYFPCDLDPKNQKYKNYQGNILKEDITQLHFSDNYFDIILCSHVLEHVVDDQLAMSELHRVMKKDGWGIMQVPVDYARKNTYEDFRVTSEEGREKAFGQKDHVRLYGKDFKERLLKAGFDVSEDRYLKSFSAEDIAKYGFDKHEIIYYCKKKSQQ